MRTPLAVLGAAALAALGGAILGEYTLSAVEAVLGGILYGVVVGELVVVVERRPARFGVAAATVFPPIGWIWSLWISTGHHLHYASVAQWVGAGAAAVGGLVWTSTAGRTIDRIRGPEETPGPADQGL